MKKAIEYTKTFLMFVAFCFSFVLIFNEDKTSEIQGEAHLAAKGEMYEKQQKPVLKKLNYNIKAMHLQDEYNKHRVSQENQEVNAGDVRGYYVSPEDSLKAPIIGYGVNLDSQKNFDNVNSDTTLDDTNNKDLSNRIYTKTALKEWMENQEQLEEEAFVEEFIENARRDGFDIELNKNHEIVSIRRIQSREVSY